MLINQQQCSAHQQNHTLFALENTHSYMGTDAATISYSLQSLG